MKVEKNKIRFTPFVVDAKVSKDNYAEFEVINGYLFYDVVSAYFGIYTFCLILFLGLKENSKQLHAQAYQTPETYKATIKRKVDRLPN